MDNESPDEHGSLSRRGLVVAAGVAAAGAVALGASRTPAVAAAVPALGAGSAGDGRGAAGSVGGELVVHVRDARSGEMDVYVGTRHVAVRDPALAARLVDAAR